MYEIKLNFRGMIFNLIGCSCQLNNAPSEIILKNTPNPLILDALEVSSKSNCSCLKEGGFSGSIITE